MTTLTRINHELVESLTTYLSLRSFYRVVGGWDNRSSSYTQDPARQPRDANVSNISSGYDVYPANGTRDATSQLSSPVSSQRLYHGKSSGGYTTLQCSTPPHSKCDAPSQLFTRLTTRHGESNSSVGSAIVTHRHS